MRFHGLGTFGCTAAAVAVKIRTDSSTTSFGGKWIHDLGGTVLTNYTVQTIHRVHSNTPYCIVLVIDDKDFVKGKMTVEERLQNRVAGNESTTDLKSSDTGQNQRKSWQKTTSSAASTPFL